MNFVCDQSLVLYLPLYEPDGASFLSKDAYGHLATVAGASWRPHGRNFDGMDDYIELPNSNLFAPAAGTIEVWINLKTTQGQAYLYSCNSDNLSLFKDLNNGSIDLWYRGLLVLSVPCLPSTDNFNYLAFTFSRGSPAYGYRNGEQLALAVCSTLTPAGGATTIGANNAHSAYWLNGLLGEIRLYQRALTPLEIQQNYLATKWRYR
ncbi:MAG: LamG domain-containing protein [Chloroflexota bacterium]